MVFSGEAGNDQVASTATSLTELVDPKLGLLDWLCTRSRTGMTRVDPERGEAGGRGRERGGIDACWGGGTEDVADMGRFGESGSEMTAILELCLYLGRTTGEGGIEGDGSGS